MRDENCMDKGPANDFWEAKMSHCVLLEVRAALAVPLCSPRHCLARVNCVPSRLDKIALHVEIRLNVGRNGVSRQIAFRIPHPGLNLCGEAKSKVQVSLPGFKVFCSTPDRSVPISPQAWAAPLCAMTGSPTKKKKKNLPQSRQQGLCSKWKSLRSLKKKKKKLRLDFLVWKIWVITEKINYRMKKKKEETLANKAIGEVTLSH